MERTGKEQYLKVVQKSTIEDLLSIADRVVPGQLEAQTLALRKIARCFKEEKMPALFSDPRYKRLKLTVLQSIDHLSAQGLCDVLYWLRVLYESYSNLEWLGYDDLNRIEQRLAMLCHSRQFRPQQLSNVFYDAATLRISTKEIEPLVSSLLVRQEVAFNNAELNQLLTCASMIPISDQETLLTALYTYLRSTGSCELLEVAVAMFLLQTICESKNAAEELPALMPLRNMLAETVAAKVLDDEKLGHLRMCKLLMMHPTVADMENSLLSTLESTLSRAPSQSLFAEVCSVLADAHSTGMRPWPSAKAHVLPPLQQWSKERTLTEPLLRRAMWALNRVETSLQKEELNSLIDMWTSTSQSADCTIELYELVLSSSGSDSQLSVLTGRVVSSVQSIREFASTLARVKRLRRTHHTVDTIERHCSRGIVSAIKFAADQPEVLYHLMKNSLAFKDALVDSEDFFNSILFRYALRCVYQLPEEAKSVVSRLARVAKAGELDLALQPSVFPYEFAATLEGLKGMYRQPLRLDTVVGLARFASGVVSRRMCETYLQLLIHCGRNIYKCDTFPDSWTSVRTLLAGAEQSLPADLTEESVHSAIEDLGKDKERAVDFLGALRTMGELQESVRKHAAEVLGQATPTALADHENLSPSALVTIATLPDPFSLRQLTTCLSELASLPSVPATAVDAFLASFSKGLWYLTVEDVLKVLFSLPSESWQYPNTVYDALCSTLATHWKERMMTTEQLARILVWTSRAGCYHAALCYLAASRLAPRVHCLPPEQQISLLQALAIPDPAVQTVTQAVLKNLLAKPSVFVALGGLALEAIHNSNCVNDPLHKDFAEKYSKEVFNHNLYFPYVEVTPCLLRMGIPVPPVSKSRLDAVKADLRLSSVQRRAALQLHTDLSAFGGGVSLSALRNSALFTHKPLAAALEDSLEFQVFPKEVKAPVYCAETQKALWLPPRKLLDPLAQELRGDFEMYRAAMSKRVKHFLVLPTHPSTPVSRLLPLLSKLK